MLCPSCKSEMPDKARFCFECGSRIPPSREAALAMLEGSVEMPPDALEELYITRHREVSQLIMNAPTPLLKDRYQKRLAEVEEAGAVLGLAEAKAGQGGHDLPSVAPVEPVTPKAPAAPAEKPAPVEKQAEQVKPAAPERQDTPGRPSTEEVKTAGHPGGGKNKKLFVILGAVAVIVILLAVILPAAGGKKGSLSVSVLEQGKLFVDGKLLGEVVPERTNRFEKIAAGPRLVRVDYLEEGETVSREQEVEIAEGQEASLEFDYESPARIAAREAEAQAKADEEARLAKLKDEADKALAAAQRERQEADRLARERAAAEQRQREETARLNREREEAVSRAWKYVRISGGSFMMGSPQSEVSRNDNEGPQTQITVSSFYMGQYEVSQWEYQQVMGTNPSYFKGDNLPVEQVSWYDAVEYCNALSRREGLTPAYTIDKTRKDPNNSSEYDDVKWTVTWNRGANGYRLPTEAEWEYACRAGTTTPFNTGGNITTGQANYNGNNPYNNNPKGTYRAKTTPGGTFASNSWGLYDMHGNVWEWCWDWYGSYGSGAQTNPTGASSGAVRVVRGGGSLDYGQSLRSAYRYSSAPSGRYGIIGFRVVRSSI